MLATAVEDLDLYILNSRHAPTNSVSVLDLYVCSSNAFLDFSWRATEDLRGSDHYPIVPISTEAVLSPRVPRWRRHNVHHLLLLVHLNAQTPMSQVWKRVHKTVGKYTLTPPPVHSVNGVTEGDGVAVASTHVETFVIISRCASRPHTVRLVLGHENNAPDFLSFGTGSYNMPITIRDFRTALSICGNTSPGLHSVPYNIQRKSKQQKTNWSWQGCLW